jgi:hypothetical protein
MLIAEILMLVGGLYALIAGRVRLTKNMYLEGWRARIAGLFLAAPLPLAFVAGFSIGLLIGAGVLPASAESAAGIVELLLVIGGLVGAVVFALVTKPKEQDLSPMQELHPEEIEELVQELAEEQAVPERAGEQSVKTDVEASQKRKWFVGGNLAIVFAWAAGVYVGSYLETGSFSWLPENLPRIVDAATTGMRYGFCCTLPVLAFGLFLLWIVGRRFIAGKQKRASFIVAIILGVIIASVGGCLFGWFAVVEWYY